MRMMRDDMEKIFDDAASKDAGHAVQGETYLGDDGLLYCSRCHKKRQTRILAFGKEKIVNCTCDCQKEEERKYKERLEEQEKNNRIRRFRSEGIQEKYLRQCRFETADDSPYIRKAKNYVRNWEKVKQKNLGLVLWGDVGTGKSFIAACIANALIDRDVPVLMTNFSKILNQMGVLYSEQRYEYINALVSYPLLIIDDLGIERNTDYAKEQVYAVIDERYKAGLPLIVTTNLTIAQIRRPNNLADARIMSRILEMCTPVQIAGKDRREETGKKKQEVVRKVIDG